MLILFTLQRHAPTVKSSLNKNSDKDEWKEFISKPSLKYILRFWTGLANGHEPTQVLLYCCNSLNH